MYYLFQVIHCWSSSQLGGKIILSKNLIIIYFHVEGAALPDCLTGLLEVRLLLHPQSGGKACARGGSGGDQKASNYLGLR